MTQQQQHQQDDDDNDLEWEEWDGGTDGTTFLQHCLAGSMAGVAEHVLVYPLDTVKTHLQCTACFASTTKTKNSVGAAGSFASTPATATTSTWTTLKTLVLQDSSSTAAAALTTSTTGSATAPSTAGTNTASSSSSSLLRTTTTRFDPTRLWRGVQTILIGCIPAHAFYFSSYEAVKYAFTDDLGKLSGLGAMMAGAAAVFGHDLIMTPLDTMKQRLQLGHYEGMMQCAQHIYKKEGRGGGFYKSFPVTLFTNIPYGMIMVRVNEWAKEELRNNNYYNNELSVTTTSLLASSLAGAVAAGITTPLDRIKTVLQTQQLQPASCPGTCPKLVLDGGSKLKWSSAVLKIYESEGTAGFMRGFYPRILSHTPAVAISWTTYETAKQALLKYKM